MYCVGGVYVCMFASLNNELNIIQMTTNTVLNYPNIYVGTYNKYNNGSIAGEWVDLSNFDNLEDFYTYCKELHSDEVDPEFMFQDIEYDHFDLISESYIDSKIYDIYSELESNNIDIELFSEWVKHTGYEYTDIDTFQESYQGEFKDDEDFAYETAYSLGLIDHKSTWPNNCIDWDHAARELMYDHFQINGHYFRSM
jgi:antirestriction protein